MSFSTRVGLLAGATALTLTGVSHAGQGNDDMAQRLAAAEAKIASMEAASNQNWLTEQRASEIKGLVQDVLADADTRASLLQAGATSGYDKGFIVGSSDGNWLLRFNFLMQQRAIWNRLDNGAGTLPDEDSYGFENTRSKLILSGHVVNPSWFFRWDNNFGSPSGGGLNESRSGTGNAYLGHDYGNGWKIMMGSMKLPLLREEMVEAQYQLAVERSNVNYLFTGGYADGLQVSYEGDSFRVNGMFSDGARTGQTAWGGAAGGGGPPLHSEYAMTARAEFLLSGSFEQFNDFTSDPNGTNGVMIGAAAHYQVGEYGTPLPNETEIMILTADVSAEFGNFNLFGAFIFADISDAGNAAGADADPWGIVVQGGFYINPTWELFARYEFVDYDFAALSDLNILTFGVNKYFAGHNAKWTTDLGYSMDTLGFAGGVAATPANITGFRADAAGEDGQMVVRTQLQLLF